jgi:acyl-homoserine lactone synthase
MLHFVNEGNQALYKKELEDAYKLRHEIFVEEYGWKALRKADKREIDQFDSLETTHVLAIDDSGLVGYSRLLPTTGPHLLADVYPELSKKAIPRGRHIYEWSRWGVKPSRRGGTAIGNVGSQMLLGICEFAVEQGITDLTLQSHPVWITRGLELGYRVEPLGLPIEFDGSPVVAISIGVSERANRICRARLRLKDIKIHTRGTLFPTIQPSIAA